MNAEPIESGALPLDETFIVDRDHLVRSVVPVRGKPYEHRCPQASYESVAHAADEMSSGITLERLRAATNLPFTAIAVALAFMKERGCVVLERGRTNRAASKFLFEDAMIEYHALREKPEGD